MPHPAARDTEHRRRARDDELAHLDQLEAENASLRAEGERQQKRIAALERKVEELRRKAKRQAAPRSRARIPPLKRFKDRQRARQTERRKRRSLRTNSRPSRDLATVLLPPALPRPNRPIPAPAPASI